MPFGDRFNARHVLLLTAVFGVLALWVGTRDWVQPRARELSEEQREKIRARVPPLPAFDELMPPPPVVSMPPPQIVLPEPPVPRFSGPLEIPIQDRATIDFSIGAPVVRRTPEDTEALDKALRDMEQALKGVTFPAQKDAPPPPRVP